MPEEIPNDEVIRVPPERTSIVPKWTKSPEDRVRFELTTPTGASDNFLLERDKLISAVLTISGAVVGAVVLATGHPDAAMYSALASVTGTFLWITASNPK